MSLTPDELQSYFGEQYLIERELGGAGMSRVFVAHDQKLDRRIVIKVLPEELAGSLSAERFRREIRVAAGFRHPHIVPLLDAGEVGGTLYYTMPFIEGESLRSRLTRDGVLDFTVACDIAAEVADALAYAHAKGVVHRDIKPDNILIDAGHAVVVDFGIAHAVTQSEAGTLTRTGMAIGTPAYMSPEQFGSGEHVDGRADVYALGCVLYEMVTGRPPVGQRGSFQRGVENVTLRDLLPVIARALATDPGDRYDSAEAFRAALLRKGGRSTSRVAVGIAGMSLLVAATAIAWTVSREQQEEVSTSDIAQVSFSGDVRDQVISADGNWVAYESGGKLFVYDMGTSVARVLDVPGCCTGMHWLPDGLAMIYGRSGPSGSMSFTHVSRNGDGVRMVAQSTYVSFWTLDGPQKSIFAQRNAGSTLKNAPLEVIRLPLDQAGPPDTMKFRTPIAIVSGLAMSPDDKWLAVIGHEGHTSKSDSARYLLHVLSTNGVSTLPEVQHVVSDSAALQHVVSWSADGQYLHLVSRSQINSSNAVALVRRRFNARSGSLGDPELLLQIPDDATNVTATSDGQAATFLRPVDDAITDTSRSAFVQATLGKPQSGWRWLRRGTVRHHFPDISSDGRNIAYAQRTLGGYDVIIASASDSAPRRIARVESGDSLCITSLRWSPTSELIAYTTSTFATRSSHLVVMDTTGRVRTRRSVVEQAGCNRGGPFGRISWSDSGRVLHFVALDRRSSTGASYTHRVIDMAAGTERSFSSHSRSQEQMPAPFSSLENKLKNLKNLSLRKRSGGTIRAWAVSDLEGPRTSNGRIYYFPAANEHWTRFYQPEKPRSEDFYSAGELWSVDVDGNDARLEARFPAGCAWFSMDAAGTIALCELKPDQLPDVWIARRAHKKQPRR